MKIDPQHSIVPIDKTSKTKTVRPTETPAKVEVKNTVRPERHKKARGALLRWFAQIGIQPNDDTLDVVALAKQTSRREHILASNKLRNLQRILDIAMEVNIDSEPSEQVDPDWFFTFSRLAEDIHSPAMQSLWGKIAAVEITQPGSFSLRTLHLLTQITQRDAKIFNKAASLACRRKQESTPRLLVGYYQRASFLNWLRPSQQTHLNLAQFGLTYPDILSLIDMGLIFASEIETGELDTERREYWRCGDNRFEIAPRKRGTALVYYKFTSVGSELYRLASRHPKPTYLDALLSLLGNAFEVVSHHASDN
ncbi:TIGR03899 family protein [Alteromonas oceanisediminis]|uniref:TIGR03899 family protein n=1 Tax=Alteromonas oceanisediminis TaxID=2836180 RepID=UPI001BDB6CCD|nr:TIGR03899 family protein [Alteromonas oceanisediminis]MBT0585854.1 TIGR03899 family protein [Alteromonas oceanisediminis]